MTLILRSLLFFFVILLLHMRPLWLALLGKGRHAFFLISSGKGPVEELTLKIESLCQRQLLGCERRWVNDWGEWQLMVNG